MENHRFGGPSRPANFKLKNCIPRDMDEKKKRDLEDVIRQETHRGRRPIDIGTIRRKRERDALLRTLLTLATEDEFIEAIRAFGLVEK